MGGVLKVSTPRLLISKSSASIPVTSQRISLIPSPSGSVDMKVRTRVSSFSAYMIIPVSCPKTGAGARVDSTKIADSANKAPTSTNVHEIPLLNGLLNI